MRASARTAAGRLIPLILPLAAALLIFVFIPSSRASLIFLAKAVCALAALILLLLLFDRYIGRRDFRKWALKRSAPRDLDRTDIFCTNCGSRMVLRTGKRGKFKGRIFYGCSAFPACRTVIPSSIVKNGPVPAAVIRKGPAEEQGEQA